MIGISKEDLFQHYYLEEIGEVFQEYNILQGRAEEEQESFVEYVDFGTFFGF